MKNKVVEIKVSGGIVDVEKLPPGIRLRVVDLDTQGIDPELLTIWTGGGGAEIALILNYEKGLGGQIKRWLGTSHRLTSWNSETGESRSGGKA